MAGITEVELDQRGLYQWIQIEMHDIWKMDGNQQQVQQR